MYIYILGETLDWNVYGLVKDWQNLQKKKKKIPLGSNIRLPRLPPHPPTAWGHKSTASCLDFNTVPSVSALFLPLPSRPLFCLHLFCRFCFPYCKYFLYTVLSILSAILVAIKYKAVVLLEMGVSFFPREFQVNRRCNRLCIIYFFFCLEYFCH